MRPDLMLPLDCLPGLVPVGAPAVWRGESDWTVISVGHDEVHIVRHAGDDDICNGWEPLVDLALDLSAPPVDAQGWPLRIDGADVVAGMLARALGLDPSGGVLWRRAGASEWRLMVNRPGGQQAGPARLDSTERRFVVQAPVSDWGYTRGTERLWVEVPALATIDPSDPDAARLALAAVMRARVWEVER